MEVIKEESLKVLSHKDQVRFALFCAYQVKEGWENAPGCVEAIRVAELWLEDKATKRECHDSNTITYAEAFAEEIGYSAYVAAAATGTVVYYDTTAIAAYAAITASAVVDTTKITYAKNKQQIIKEQWDFFIELRDFDEIAEKILLGG